VKTFKTYQVEPVPPLPIKLDLTYRDSCVPHTLDAMWRECVSAVNPFELVDELAQAYEDSLRLQSALRPLLPKTTWHKATDAACRWQDMGWPAEELVATIMFTDIADFTALMDRFPVKNVLNSLNEYFTHLGRIIARHRGDVQKFLGDGLMALFTAPADAVAAGCEIQQAVAKFNAHCMARGLWRFETRLAIDTGDVILTSVGPPDRQDYTLIGRPVNLAAHLSEYATPGAVCISHSTYDNISSKDGFVPRTMSVARNGEQPLTAYELACP